MGQGLVPGNGGMARPQKITDEAILTAAKTFFVEQGPHASTDLLADQLGVLTGESGDRGVGQVFAIAEWLRESKGAGDLK